MLAKKGENPVLPAGHLKKKKIRKRKEKGRKKSEAQDEKGKEVFFFKKSFHRRNIIYAFLHIDRF